MIDLNLAHLRRRKKSIKEQLQEAASDIQGLASNLEDLVEELNGVGTDRQRALYEIDTFLERVKFSLIPVTKYECIDFITQLRKEIDK